MSEQPPTAETNLSERTQRLITMLERLAHQGADIATRLHEQVLERTPPGPILAALGGTHSEPVITHDIMATFDLIARAIRRTALLVEHLAKPPTPPPAPRATPQRPRPEPITPEPVETIRPLRPNPAEADLYQPEYRERLDRVDELGARPTAEIIAGICQDLETGEKHLARLSDQHEPSQPAPLPHGFGYPPAPESFDAEAPTRDGIRLDENGVIPNHSATNHFPRRKP